MLVLVGAAVQPERCERPDQDEVRAAARAAVGWFAANIAESGRFLYRYDLSNGELGGYNDPRHVGVMFSLYQAASAGIPQATGTADQGLAYLDRHIRQSVVGPVFGRGAVVPTGASALALVALAQRRTATGDTSRDQQMPALGRSLLATVGPSGEVAAMIDLAEGPVGTSRSAFATGQVMYALALLHDLVVAGVIESGADGVGGVADGAAGVVAGGTGGFEGFGAAALRIRDYLMTRRDDLEDHFPQLSDHWATYGLVAMARWDEPPDQDAATRAWIDRQLGLFSLQIRYESQRSGGLSEWIRGSEALPAGVGTLGEGLANLAWLVRSDPRLARDYDAADHLALDRRLACVAGLLVQRQINGRQTDNSATSPGGGVAAADVAAGGAAVADIAEGTAVKAAVKAAVNGAWFRAGVTQMDDQQHPLSALLLIDAAWRRDSRETSP